MDFITFQDELLKTTNENIKLATEYREARKLNASCLNQLTILLVKSGLEKSKKELKNKIVELLSHPEYGNEAHSLYSQLLASEADYKGLELVCKAYSNHTSGLQSILKMQIMGESKVIN